MIGASPAGFLVCIYTLGPRPTLNSARSRIHLPNPPTHARLGSMFLMFGSGSVGPAKPPGPWLMAVGEPSFVTTVLALSTHLPRFYRADATSVISVHDRRVACLTPHRTGHADQPHLYLSTPPPAPAPVVIDTLDGTIAQPPANPTPPPILRFFE
jgi:hypothetical protein